MKHRFWLVLHRWSGLFLAAFLILEGLTGSLLVFERELNMAITPDLFPGTNPVHTLPLGELALKAQAVLPDATVTRVYVDSTGAAIIGFEPHIDPATRKPRRLGFDQVFLDSVSGRYLGHRTRGGPPVARSNLMGFLLRLHGNLAMQRTGLYILGVVALIWTFDCFVGFYLTLPPLRVPRAGDSFWRRWKPAWQIRRKLSAYRLNLDLHRASGLWLWAALFLFAWSSVAFCLRAEVYKPVMGLFLDMTEDAPVAHAGRHTGPVMAWPEAQATGQRLMAEQARQRGFSVVYPVALYHLTPIHRFHYRVRSSADIEDINGSTLVEFDDRDGSLARSYVSTGEHSGTTVTTWLLALHMANIFGRPYAVFVCLLGLVTVMLSVTGVYLWWAKRVRQPRHQND